MSSRAGASAVTATARHTRRPPRARRHRQARWAGRRRSDGRRVTACAWACARREESDSTCARCWPAREFKGSAMATVVRLAARAPPGPRGACEPRTSALPPCSCAKRTAPFDAPSAPAPLALRDINTAPRGGVLGDVDACRPLCKFWRLCYAWKLPNTTVPSCPTARRPPIAQRRLRRARASYSPPRPPSPLPSRLPPARAAQLSRVGHPGQTHRAKLIGNSQTIVYSMRAAAAFLHCLYPSAALPPRRHLPACAQPTHKRPPPSPSSIPNEPKGYTSSNLASTQTVGV